MKYILDTNSVTTTVITLCELFYGAEKSKKKDENLSVVRDMIEKIGYENLNRNTSEIYGKIKAELQAKGMMVDDFDILIASICLEQDAVLVTDNLRHFERIKDLRMENWKTA